jgi:hypothetical protein
MKPMAASSLSTSMVAEESNYASAEGTALSDKEL